ncbi:hypothetical protein LPB86_06690 [Pedobacter sp. MC2016-14]|uniref:hypothetical protein n=1 Tax=Pedobacter sp. MC2016-14 TaxID=2897327 RepID=UPI001E466404|nr:hypothetical protein [Pedobacter sp. MC2016-14]MCD0487908.1 hypothetical protein [Pedobacter sp. MC2016-14]
MNKITQNQTPPLTLTMGLVIKPEGQGSFWLKERYLLKIDELEEVGTVYKLFAKNLYELRKTTQMSRQFAFFSSGNLEWRWQMVLEDGHIQFSILSLIHRYVETDNGDDSEEDEKPIETEQFTWKGSKEDYCRALQKMLKVCLFDE